MTRPTGALATFEYPGRLLALGRESSAERAVIIYAITGRSPSSLARKLVFRDAGIWVEPTDEDVLNTGNAELLVYPAVLFEARGIAASNGRQTADILARLREGGGPVQVLAGALESWDYEPDAPNFTPRISGCLIDGRAGLGLVRRGPGGVTMRDFFEFPLRPGEARMIATYEGPNRDPLPGFSGDPRELLVEGRTPGETAESVYEALEPRAPGRDFRVAVACVFASLARPADFLYAIVNRHERA